MTEKIIPNKVYHINMLNYRNQTNIMARVCATLRYAKENPIDSKIFIKYITRLFAYGRCVVFVTFNEKQELNSCVVMVINNHPIKGRILFIEWAWCDKEAGFSLGKNVMKDIDHLAMDLQMDKIAGAMSRTRGFKGLFRKYGFIKAYCVVEKNVKEMKVEDVEEAQKDT